MKILKHGMTYGELYEYVKEQLNRFFFEKKVIDWRPASDFYIDDIVKIITNEGQTFLVIPLGIRLWLENGDSIIYVKQEKPEAHGYSRDEAIKIALEKSIVGGGGKGHG